LTTVTIGTPSERLSYAKGNVPGTGVLPESDFVFTATDCRTTALRRGGFTLRTGHTKVTAWLDLW